MIINKTFNWGVFEFITIVLSEWAILQYEYNCVKYLFKFTNIAEALSYQCDKWRRGLGREYYSASSHDGSAASD
jgi:hypothetical protein